MATVKDFVRKDPSELHGPAHPCDAPDISGTEFLYAVMRDRSLPLTQRIRAAGELMRLYPDESFTPSLKIIIPYQGSLTKDPGPDNTNQQANSPSRLYNPRPLPGAFGPSYIERTFDDPTFTDNQIDDHYIDYSKPPSPDEIEEIKAAVHALRPDYDLPSHPLTLHLCACDHWLTFPCDCATRTRH